MPRIRQEWIESIIYIYPDVESAVKGKSVGGSGFIVGAKSVAFPGHSCPFAVTNRHVVMACGPQPVIRQNAEDKGRPLLAVTPTRRDDWIFHDGGDDIAVHPVFLRSPTVPSASFRHTFLPEDCLLTKEMVDSLDIGPGDEVFMIGRFFDHEGRQGNTPALRFGQISMMPGEPIEQKATGLLQESFVVEGRSIAGYSGSPVWVYIPPFSYRPQLRQPTGPHWQGPWLLGIDWGHLKVPELVEDPGGKPHPDRLRVLANSGMLAVVPAWKLRELLYQEELVTLREEADSNHRLVEGPAIEPN